MNHERLVKFYSIYFSAELTNPNEIKEFLFQKLDDPRFKSPYLDMTIQLFTQSKESDNVYFMHSKNNIVHNESYDSGLHFLKNFADDPLSFERMYLTA